MKNKLHFYHYKIKQVKRQLNEPSIVRVEDMLPKGASWESHRVGS